MSRLRAITGRLLLGAAVLLALLAGLYAISRNANDQPEASVQTQAAGAARSGWDQDVISWDNADPPRPAAKRTWLLPRETPLQEGYVLILTDAATGRGDLVITDPAALKEAQGRAYIEHRHLGIGNSIFVSVISLGQALSKVSILAHSGHGGWISNHLDCWWCASDDPDAMPRDFAALLDHADKVERIVLHYDTREAYDAAFRPLRAREGTWISMAGSFWSDATDTQPARGQIVTWQRQLD